MKVWVQLTSKRVVLLHPALTRLVSNILIKLIFPLSLHRLVSSSRHFCNQSGWCYFFFLSPFFPTLLLDKRSRP